MTVDRYAVEQSLVLWFAQQEIDTDEAAEIMIDMLAAHIGVRANSLKQVEAAADILRQVVTDKGQQVFRSRGAKTVQ